jgi:hypothetical protein
VIDSDDRSFKIRRPDETMKVVRRTTKIKPTKQPKIQPLYGAFWFEDERGIFAARVMSTPYNASQIAKDHRKTSRVNDDGVSFQRVIRIPPGIPEYWRIRVVWSCIVLALTVFMMLFGVPFLFSN